MFKAMERSRAEEAKHGAPTFGFWTSDAPDDNPHLSLDPLFERQKQKSRTYEAHRGILSWQRKKKRREDAKHLVSLKTFLGILKDQIIGQTCFFAHILFCSNI